MRAAAAFAAGWVLLAAAPGFALRPDRFVSQAVRRTWLAEEGLPQDSVLALARGRDGYLWLGTGEGLVRFDGVRFTVFNRRTTPVLPSNSVAAILEDAEGRLWVGTGRGLVRREAAGFVPVPSELRLRVSALHRDRAGRLWVGTLGDGLWRLEANRLVPAEVASGRLGRRVRDIDEDSSGRIWIATEAGVAILAAGEHRLLTREDGLLSNDTFALLSDPDGTVWIGTQEGLQARRGDEWTHSAREPALRSEMIRSLHRDREGSLWIATQGGGIARLAGGRIENFSREDGLSGNDVEDIDEDPEGNLWLGLSGGGLVRLRDGKLVGFGRKEGLPADAVFSVYETRSGDMLLGTRGGGLARLGAGSAGPVETLPFLAKSVVTSTAEDRSGVLWVGTYGAGLARIENGNVRILGPADGLADDSIYALLASRDGSLWIGTGAGGLQRLANGRLTPLGPADGLPEGVVQALLEEPSGTLWIGTRNGLARYSGGRISSWNESSGLADLSVLALHADPNGAIWIGTAGGGLQRFHRGAFGRISARDGLHEDTIGRILEDGAGRFWMSSNRGIFSVPRAELEAFLEGKRATVTSTAYGPEDGMPAAECNAGTYPAGWAGRDGRLWFPTSRGVAVVDPARLAPNGIVPSVTIEAVRADGRPFDPSDGIVLPAGTRTLEIDYAALSFREPSRVAFRFRLDGTESSWTEAGARRTAYFTEPRHGEHLFRVVACNDDGLWNETGATLRFRVAPRLVETTWFRGAALLAFLLLLVAAHRLRVWRLRARQAELELLVEQRTAELARANRELDRLARLDGLTRIPNRRAFDEAFSQAVADHARRASPLAVVMGDIDYFKRYNDSEGHQGGDRVLRTVARLLEKSLHREGDLVARYGGEEMVFLLPDTDSAGAERIANLALDAVRAAAIPHPQSEVAAIVTMSLGGASIVPSEGEPEGALIERADRALYRAKAEGRNRVVVI